MRKADALKNWFSLVLAVTEPGLSLVSQVPRVALWWPQLSTSLGMWALNVTASRGSECRPWTHKGLHGRLELPQSGADGSLPNPLCRLRVWPPESPRTGQARHGNLLFERLWEPSNKLSSPVLLGLGGRNQPWTIVPSHPGRTTQSWLKNCTRCERPALYFHADLAQLQPTFLGHGFFGCKTDGNSYFREPRGSETHWPSRCLEASLIIKDMVLDW